MSTDLSPRLRTGILATMCLALVAVVASVAGLNVALNDLAVDLEASSSQVLWIVNAYTLTLAALLLPLGEAGDRWGRRRMLLVGLTVFGGANLAATTAGDAETLIAYRVLAGAGAAMIMPATLSTLTSIFPPSERGRAVGIWAGFAGAGGIIGLFASAVLIDNVTWPWLFAVPVVAATLAGAATLTLVPETRNEGAGRLDLIGSLLAVVAVGGIVLGVEEGPEAGWTAPITLLALGGGAAALAAFGAWELRQRHPVLDVRIFRDRALAAGSVSLTVLFALMMGSFLVVIQYLQAVLDLSAVAAAAGLLPMAVAMMGLSPSAPRVAERVGLTTMLSAGSVLLALGFVWLAIADASYLGVLPGLILLGAGMGVGMSPATTAITESLPPEKQGVASALNDTVREFGSALGIALIGSVLASGYESEIETTAETLPPELAEPVGEGIGQAMAVAESLGPDGAAVADAAREAFLSGWEVAMVVAAIAAVVGGVGVRLLAGRHAEIGSPEPGSVELAA